MMLSNESLIQISSQTRSLGTGPGKHGRSWNFILAFSRTGKAWKKATGPGKLWKSAKHLKRQLSDLFNMVANSHYQPS